MLSQLKKVKYPPNLSKSHPIKRKFSHFTCHDHTRFSSYKNILYKNIEDEMGQKVKNILRICSS